MEGKPLIAFFGIDGCGKTTLIKELSKKIEKKGEKVKVIYMGLGNEFNLPFLKTVMKISSSLRRRKGKENINSWRESNFRKRNFFWILIEYLELWIRYLKAKKLSKDNIVLFDRFFYDGLILAGGFSYRFFRHFTPIPDVSFLIFAPSKIILKRKNEAGIENIKNYYGRAQKLEGDFPIIKIDNSKKIPAVVDKIYSCIYPPSRNEREIFNFLNKNSVRYAFLRGSDHESREKGKDLDILILKEDYEKIKKKIPKIKMTVDFYSDCEKHFGIVFVPRGALFRRRFDKNRGAYVLSKSDSAKMKFLRKILHAGRKIKKIFGGYKND